MARIGLFGGTFNPPHNGHMALARAALNELGLDELILLPAGNPPHKPVDEDPGPLTRWELCAAAADGNEALSVSRAEIEREGPSWTVDTLETFHTAMPHDELVLILGEDAAATLGEWRDPGRVVELATVAWARRSQSRSADIAALVASLGSARPPECLTMEPLDVSSSMVREAVRSGLDLDPLVPERVASMIGELGLYHREPE